MLNFALAPWPLALRVHSRRAEHGQRAAGRSPGRLPDGQDRRVADLQHPSLSLWNCSAPAMTNVRTVH